MVERFHRDMQGLGFKVQVPNTWVVWIGTRKCSAEFRKVYDCWPLGILGLRVGNLSKFV